MATTKYKSLDESHGIIHSFNTLHYAQNIFEHHLKSQFPTYLMKCIDPINDMLSIYVEDYNFFSM